MAEKKSPEFLRFGLPTFGTRPPRRTGPDKLRLYSAWLTRRNVCPMGAPRAASAAGATPSPLLHRALLNRSIGLVGSSSPADDAGEMTGEAPGGERTAEATCSPVAPRCTPDGGTASRGTGPGWTWLRRPMGGSTGLAVESWIIEGGVFDKRACAVCISAKASTLPVLPPLSTLPTLPKPIRRGVTRAAGEWTAEVRALVTFTR